MKKSAVIILIALMAVIAFAQEAPVGSAGEISKKEKESLESLKGKIDGSIVWSSSRSNSRHDIWIMNADGTNKRQLTSGDHVDWYSRFCPEGKRVLFARSKYGWTAEKDADTYDKWDLWVTDIDSSSESRVAENCCWGTWRPSGDSIVFARGAKVFVMDLSDSSEKVLLNTEEKFKKGTIAQQPQLSPDGKLLAMTLRGSVMETGIWNFQKSEWYSTGKGCQIDWFPDGRRVLRMNEGQGNGSTEVLAIEIDSDGKPVDKIAGLKVPKKIRFMDLPGRRSHEYFPKLDQTGEWLVWCATQYGHEHDIYDYEVYVWNINTDKKKDFVRLTFHSGNDRWPDIYINNKQEK
ncbi:MAG TPA: hypothetical protein VKY57_11735 [Chitinispirillaceae bacterium]|nr:hypothetical protein [Chitinispirillaceae bacterium]